MVIAQVNDTKVRDDVIAELDFQPYVDLRDVVVSVKDGIVSLTGVVPSYSMRHAIEEAAHRVYGVRGIANEMAVCLPPGVERADVELADAAVQALAWDTDVPQEALSVAVSGGRLTLSGEVAWDYQRQAALAAVRRLAGVIAVANRVTVRTTAQATDIEGKIESALIRSAQTDAHRIQVQARGDHVILDGSVRSVAERQEAERAAWSAEGVTTVENRISVIPSA